MYLILFSITMDYLPIQASSVPCECIFSSRTETDTKKRNKISPKLMEALQMLKYHFKHSWLDFSQCEVVSQWEVMDDPKDPIVSDRTGLQGEDMREAVNELIRAVEHDEAALAEIM